MSRYNGLAELEKWNAAKGNRKSKVAKNAHHGIPAISEEMSELKKEMAAPDGFHTICKERDRVCADCQNYYGRVRKAGRHGDHIIPQAQCSKEERLDPKFGTGVCAECNKLREQKTHRAAILESGELFYQVRWNPSVGICKRRLMSDPPGAWFGYELPAHFKDGNRYQE